MPPVGSPDTQAPQGPAMPISAGETAAKNEAFGHYDAANQQQFESNVPPKDAQTMPAEEAIPADVMPPTPGAIKVPVAAPTAPAPIDATAAFAPKPLEAPPSPATAPTPPTYPTPDWEAMASSTKAGAEPAAPTAESPTAAAYGELDQNNLEKEASGDPHMEALKWFASGDFKQAAAILEIAANEKDPELRKQKIAAAAPVMRQALDDLEKSA